MGAHDGSGGAGAPQAARVAAARGAAARAGSRSEQARREPDLETGAREPLAPAGTFAVVSAPRLRCSAVRRSAARPGALHARVPASDACQSDAVSACSGRFFFFWGCSKVKGRPDKFAASNTSEMQNNTDESTSLESRILQTFLQYPVFWRATAGLLLLTGSCEDDCAGDLYLEYRGIAAVALGVFEGVPRLEVLYIIGNPLLGCVPGVAAGVEGWFGRRLSLFSFQTMASGRNTGRGISTRTRVTEGRTWGRPSRRQERCSAGGPRARIFWSSCRRLGARIFLFLHNVFASTIF
jgi:hypothetical protein